MSLRKIFSKKGSLCHLRSFKERYFIIVFVLDLCEYYFNQFSFSINVSRPVLKTSRSFKKIHVLVHSLFQVIMCVRFKSSLYKLIKVNKLVSEVFLFFSPSWSSIVDPYFNITRVKYDYYFRAHECFENSIVVNQL